MQFLIKAPTAAKLEDIMQCTDKSLQPKTAQRGKYEVMYNYAPMSKSVHCWESVTYTTHGDFTFLGNVEPLMERWRAPLSIAVYAPGDDFALAVKAVKYLRNCAKSSLVKEWVTFHIFYDNDHIPEKVSMCNKLKKT